MCNPGKAIARATGLSHFTERPALDDTLQRQQQDELVRQTKALQDAAAAQQEQTQIAKDSAAAALAAQQDAVKRAKAAAVPAIDSESARAASDQRMRQLITASGGVTSGQRFFGAPPIGYRLLMGA